MRWVFLPSVLTCLILLGTGHAQPAADDPVVPPTDAEPAEPPQVPAAVTPSLEELVRDLKEENEGLREELELLRDDQTYLEERVDKLAPVSGKLTGFLDLGLFSVSGDGSGIRTDAGHAHFPEYGARGIPDSWVFLGDPLSTAVNSRGDPATTGESRAVTFDGIGGRSATFLVNSLNVGLFAEVGKRSVFTAKVDFLPRGRDISRPDGLFLGDYVDVRLAYFEHRIVRKSMKLDLFAGKFDSVLGFEYRSQEAPSRIEVTPSLICRYTCGYPIGLKARARWFDDALVLNVAVTNGSHASEGFPFNNEIDANDVKTVAGRLSMRVREVELGVSGLVGAQDAQPANDVLQWMYGVDAHYHRDDLVIRAEFVQGRARGVDDPAVAAACALVPCLTFKGAYGLVGYRVTNVVMPYARVDWRDALHESGASFVYISRLWRVTPGIRLTLSENLIIKAEYTVNRELGRIPQFANDVFTSSFVVKY